MKSHFEERRQFCAGQDKGLFILKIYPHVRKVQMSLSSDFSSKGPGFSYSQLQTFTFKRERCYNIVNFKRDDNYHNKYILDLDISALL